MVNDSDGRQALDNSEGKQTVSDAQATMGASGGPPSAPSKAGDASSASGPAPNNRRALLESFVAQNPQDAFALYGLAMDHAREGTPTSAETALGLFAQLRDRQPNYAAGYQQAGQLLVSLDRLEEARVWLRAGIAAAQREGNRHAAGEMEGILEEIGPGA